MNASIAALLPLVNAGDTEAQEEIPDLKAKVTATSEAIVGMKTPVAQVEILTALLSKKKAAMSSTEAALGVAQQGAMDAETHIRE